MALVGPGAVHRTVHRITFGQLPTQLRRAPRPRAPACRLDELVALLADVGVKACACGLVAAAEAVRHGGSSAIRCGATRPG
jgi:hypothetical protein